MKTYIIVTLLKGKAKHIQENLLQQISKRFDVHEAIKQKPPAHITLKYPFKTKKIETVEHIISRISKETKPFSFKLKGFNHFEKDVIFIEVPGQNGKLRKLQQEIYKTLKEKKEFEMGPYDSNIHFHATACRKDIKAKFSDIWNFISNIDLNLKTTCDNITILELKHGTWKIHKEFKIN